MKKQTEINATVDQTKREIAKLVRGEMAAQQIDATTLSKAARCSLPTISTLRRTGNANLTTVLAVLTALNCKMFPERDGGK